ncbi:hypothetical protein GCM10009548_11780 [Streptomyces malaysiensis subsp. malaysiensis]
MKWTVTALTLLGGGLPAMGLYFAWRDFGARRKELQAKLERVEQIMSDPAIPDADKSSRLEQEAPPEGSWTDVLYGREYLQLQLLKQTVPDISRPAVLAGLGVLCSTTAGLLSIWAGM